MCDRITVHDILCGGQGKIGNTVLQEWTENMYKAKSPPGALYFTLKVLVEALLILPVIIQVQFKSLRKYF